MSSETEHFRECANGSNTKMGTDFEIFSNNLNISVSLRLANASIDFQGNNRAHECTVIVSFLDETMGG